MSSLYALGLNHQTAPLAVRERVVFHVERLRDALGELKSSLASEAAILSTCNRTELYIEGEQPAAAAEWLAQYHRVQPAELTPYLYTLPRDQAVRHAFRVASGLDSMVLGEPQILGQMKDAARAAESAGTLGTVLHKLFQRSFAVAKEVRTTTRVGANSLSMAAAAVKLAARIFPSLKDQNVLLIGAGEMIELCATHFAAQGPARITVANRTLERAQKRAHHGAEVPAWRAARVRHRGFLHCFLAADPRQGAGGAGAPREAPSPDVHRRSRGAARHRAGSGRARRRIPLQHRRPRAAGERQHRHAALGGRASRGDHRHAGRPVHALAAGARERAPDPRAARPRR